jgi:photosystem II stability/assembly factor-like uncharacterized protein
MKTINKLIAVVFILIGSVCFSQGWVSQTSGLTTFISSVQFLNTLTGYAAGSNGNIVKTTNGGTNWVPLASGVTENFNSLQFINVNTGWISGTPGAVILKTTNGGANWHSYSTGENTQIFVADSSAIYGIGGGGSIIKSTNGGANWTPQTSGTTQFLTDSYFINSNTGWISGFEGTILKTTNAGTNWVHQSSGTSAAFYSIFFLDANYGWAVGEGGTMKRTTNGGTNWLNMVSPSGESLLSVFFISSQIGWVSGDIGLILATTNGGANWSSMSTPNSESLNGLFFTGFKGWSTGSNGTIISTNTGGYAVGMPILNSPANNIAGIMLTPQLKWNTVQGAASYRVQLSTDSNFATTLVNDSTITDTSYTVQNGVLQNNVKYCWRIRAKNANGSGLYSAVWNFTTSLTGISQNVNESPDGFKLYNNFPNPFNPVTNIKFSLPERSATKLTVYDINGKESATLLNEHLSSGVYEVEFDAANLSSGTYFYSLVSGNHRDVKKMILIK